MKAVNLFVQNIYNDDYLILATLVNDDWEIKCIGEG